MSLLIMKQEYGSNKLSIFIPGKKQNKFDKTYQKVKHSLENIVKVKKSKALLSQRPRYNVFDRIRKSVIVIRFNAGVLRHESVHMTSYSTDLIRPLVFASKNTEKYPWRDIRSWLVLSKRLKMSIEIIEGLYLNGYLILTLNQRRQGRNLLFMIDSFWIL